MSRTKTLIKGTFILTATGFITRVMGFFYRIFLSRAFHAEGVGLYQLIFPVYSLIFSFTSAGIQIALSRIVAGKSALQKNSEAVRSLKTALFFTVSLSFISMLLLQHYANEIAVTFLQEERCGFLLIAMSYSFPFAAIHSCICGYCLGLKQTKVPAISQLFEQTARITSVWFFYCIGLHYSSNPPITIAVLGLVLGELIAAVYSIFTLRKILFSTTVSTTSYFSSIKELFSLSLPLTSNRVMLNILQSIEAVSIPTKLQSYGMSLSDALSTYGILTGMALPCILFPSAITNSVSTMLLPTVAEIQASDNRNQIKRLTRQVAFTCFSLGFGCMIVFFLTGNFIGNIVFHNPEAGKYILILAFICPFLYTNTALISILNGLGRTTTTFLINTTGLLLRIGSIYFLIPSFGILGYLWGLLASQLVISILCIYQLFIENHQLYNPQKNV